MPPAPIRGLPPLLQSLIIVYYCNGLGLDSIQQAEQSEWHMNTDKEDVVEDRRRPEATERRQKRDPEVEALFKQFGASEERVSDDRRTDDG